MPDSPEHRADIYRLADIRDRLADIRDRLVKAVVELDAIADSRQNNENYNYYRVIGKAQGVRLAISYLDEMLRTTAPAQSPLDTEDAIRAAQRKADVGSDGHEPEYFIDRQQDIWKRVGPGRYSIGGGSELNRAEIERVYGPLLPCDVYGDVS